MTKQHYWGEPERAPQVVGTTLIFSFVRACPNAFYCNDHCFLMGRPCMPRGFLRLHISKPISPEQSELRLAGQTKDWSS